MNEVWGYADKNFNTIILTGQSTKVKATLRLTVSQLVCLGVESNLGLLTRDFFFPKVTVLSFWGALSDERSGLSFVSLCHCSLQWSVTIYIDHLQIFTLS
jgi:hypothetical protein